MVVNYWSLVHNSWDVLIDLGSDGMGSFSIWDFFWYGIFCHGSFWYSIFCPDTGNIISSCLLNHFSS